MRQLLRLMALLLALAALFRPGTLWAQCVATSLTPGTTTLPINLANQKPATEATTGTQLTSTGYAATSAEAASTAAVANQSVTYPSRIYGSVLSWQRYDSTDAPSTRLTATPLALSCGLYLQPGFSFHS